MIYTVKQSIKDDPLVECEFCNEHSIQRVIHSPDVLVKVSDPKTLGLLADRNSKKLGKFGVEDKTKEIKDEYIDRKNKYVGKLPDGAKSKETESYTPPWRPNTTGPDLSLSKLTPKQKEKYIFEGKKPIV